jgi:predicted acyltransferase
MVDDLVYPFFQFIVGAFSHFQERARQQFERAQDVANGRLGRHGTMEAWRFFFCSMDWFKGKFTGKTHI